MSNKKSNLWIEALKKHNKGKGVFCVPRKGSDEYNDVIKIYATLKPKPAVPKPVPKPVVPKAVVPKSVPVDKKEKALKDLEDMLKQGSVDTTAMVMFKRKLSKNEITKMLKKYSMNQYIPIIFN